MSSLAPTRLRQPPDRQDVLRLAALLPILVVTGILVALLAERSGTLKVAWGFAAAMAAFASLRDLRIGALVLLVTLGIPFSSTALLGIELHTTHLLLLLAALQLTVLAGAGRLQVPRGLLAPLGLMLAGGLLASLAGPEPAIGLERLGHGLILPALGGVAVACVVRSVGIGQLPLAIAAGLALASLAAYGQWIGLAPGLLPAVEKGRVDGLLGHPNLLGGYLTASIVLVVGVAATARGRGRVATWMLYGSALLGLIALVLTLSRGAMLSLAAGLTVVVALLFFRRRRAASLLMVLGVVCGIALVLPSVPESQRAEVVQRFEQLRRPGAQSGRLLVYREVRISLGEHWLTGVGPLVFGDEIERRSRVGGLEPNLRHGHSIVLETWLSLGLLGLGGLVWLVVGAMRRFLRSSRHTTSNPAAAGWAIGSLGAVTALLAQGLVDFAFVQLELMVLAFVLLGSAYGLSAREAAPGATPAPLPAPR